MKVLLIDNLFYYIIMFVTCINMQQLIWAAECNDSKSLSQAVAKTIASVSCAHCCVCTEVYSQSRDQLQSQLSAASLVRLLSISRAYGRKDRTGPWWHQPGQRSLYIELVLFRDDHLPPSPRGPQRQLAREEVSHQRAVRETWDRLAVYVVRV